MDATITNLHTLLVSTRIVKLESFFEVAEMTKQELNTLVKLDLQSKELPLEPLELLITALNTYYVTLFSIQNTTNWSDISFSDLKLFNETRLKRLYSKPNSLKTPLTRLKDIALGLTMYLSKETHEPSNLLSLPILKANNLTQTNPKPLEPLKLEETTKVSISPEISNDSLKLEETTKVSKNRVVEALKENISKPPKTSFEIVGQKTAKNTLGKCIQKPIGIAPIFERIKTFLES